MIPSRPAGAAALPSARLARAAAWRHTGRKRELLGCLRPRQARDRGAGPALRIGLTVWAAQNRRMAADSHDDDPTRALDDFVRRMRPGAADAPAPDLSDLVSRLQTERSPVAARPRGGKLRNGQTWDADDVQDVPVVELPRAARQRQGEPELQLPPVPPPPDPQAVEAALRGARDRAAAQWQADGAAQSRPDWQPEAVARLPHPRADARLLAAWQPGAWIGAVREVMAGGTEFVRSADGQPTVQTWPPQRLLLLWAPPRVDGPTPGRWPQCLRLSAVSARQAAAALLADVPDGASLWLADDAGDIDWALAAELALLHDPSLRPFQLEGLRSFMATEREACYARLNSSYQPADAAGTVRRR